MDARRQFERKTRTAALNRRSGAYPDARAAIAKQNAQFDDWRSVCRLCGAELEGTLTDLAEHSCDT